MRRTKYAGLNNRAKELVAAAVKTESVGNISALFYSLKRYTMPDGSIYTEYQQAVVESICQVYFTALRDKNGVIVESTLWEAAEMRTW